MQPAKARARARVGRSVGDVVQPLAAIIGHDGTATPQRVYSGERGRAAGWTESQRGSAAVFVRRLTELVAPLARHWNVFQRGAVVGRGRHLGYFAASYPAHHEIARKLQPALRD